MSELSQKNDLQAYLKRKAAHIVSKRRKRAQIRRAANERVKERRDDALTKAFLFATEGL